MVGFKNYTSEKTAFNIAVPKIIIQIYIFILLITNLLSDILSFFMAKKVETNHSISVKRKKNEIIGEIVSIFVL